MQSGTLLAIIFNHAAIFIALAVLAVIAWHLWVTYINTLYLESIPWVLLEITPPKEIFKSPEAMEIVLNSLDGGGASNTYLKYWKGEVGQNYSLEIASIEGSIHFYVRFHSKFRKAFEAQFYSQYPDAIITEVDDYTKRVPDYTKNGPIKLFGYNLKLNKDDPYPIKTYIDYGLDRAIGSLDENQRIDPITPLLETMGSIGIGEQIWVQINIRQATKRYEVKKKKDGVETIEKGKSWKDKSREIIEELKTKANSKDADGKTIAGKLSRGEQNVIEAIERHRNKPGFDAGIRVIYLADGDHFSGNTISAFTAMFRQFNSEDLNSFGFSGMTKSPDEPWKDMFKKNLEKGKEAILSDYKNRDFFYDSFNAKKPWQSFFKRPEDLDGKPIMLLSSEELATIFHLPGRVAATPTFLRAQSTKAEPPANLPF